MKPIGLHHVGLVVPSERLAGSLMALLGLEETHRGFVESYGALCIFTRAGDGSHIELVVPTGGPLARFNKGLGGLHHIALAVESITEVARELDARGMKLLEDAPIRGAGDFLCNFLPPAHTRGVVRVEFVQELSRE